jgi:bifunctional N-acetylglucosamine-1-phosphate-uridyltransferase/glucosamine-1-phosphate-acetyltransferase GlmU-like protein
MSYHKHIKAVVLAAGKGTRLQTEGCDLPKVMREACGQPLISYVLDAISFIDNKDIILVVGYKKEDILARYSIYPYAVQAEQLGTGHAVMSAENALQGFDGSVLICYGDMPLLSQHTYKALVSAHFYENNDCTILSSNSNEKLPYGRIVRDNHGNFVKIVEDRDCSETEKLLPALAKLKNNNAQGEYYLTDVPAILRSEGSKVGICTLDLGNEIIGVNTLEQLHQVETFINKRD